MEPVILAQQSSVVSSQLRELFPCGCEQQPSTLGELKHTFFGMTNRLLNITEGPYGEAVVDIARQPNLLERSKSEVGVWILTTLDWLWQVGRNIEEANKPALVAQGATGVLAGMGVPLFYAGDMIEPVGQNTLIMDVQQERVEQQTEQPCPEALEAMRGLCAANEVNAVIGSCVNGGGRFDAFIDGRGLGLAPLTDGNALQSPIQFYTCSGLGFPLGDPASVTGVVAISNGENNLVPSTPVAAVEATAPSPMGAVKCIDSWVINIETVEAVQSGVRQACVGPDGNPLEISEPLAQLFIDQSRAGGWLGDEVYAHNMVINPDDAGEFFEGWLQGNDPGEPTPAPISMASGCDLDNPPAGSGIVVNFTDAQTLASDLYNQCGIQFPSVEAVNAFIQLTEIGHADPEVIIPLDVLKVLVEKSGAQVIPTPVAFEGAPPTPAVSTPVPAGEQIIMPGGETPGEDGGFWNMDIFKKLYKITGVVGFNETRFKVLAITGIAGFMALASYLADRIKGRK